MPTPPPPAPGPPGFTLRRLQKPEEFRAAEELQRAAAGGSDEAPVPVPVLRGAQDHGGLVLGAFAELHLAGLSVGLLGWDGTSLYHYVHRFVVRPEYLNHGLGRRLADGVRAEVRQQGLGVVRGTFDPLLSHAAALAVRELGARPDRYLVHYYGQSADPGAVDRETDRLRWSWRIDGEGPEAPADGGRPAAPRAPDPRFAAAAAIVGSEVGETGLRVPTSVTEPTAPTVTLEIPFDIALLREHDPTAARRWRHAVRDAFRASFDLGYRVEAFDVVRADHERRSYYLLAAPAPAGPSA